MGSIIGSKVRDDGKIIFEICVDKKEAMQLKGQVDEVYMFAAQSDAETTKIVQRGKNEATMYFLVPKNAREELKKLDEASFQEIKLSRKKIYIYSVKSKR